MRTNSGNNMLKKIIYAITAVLVLISIYLVFFIAPIPIDPGSAAGDPNNFKIFYFHLPIAISAYLSFAIVFVFKYPVPSKQETKMGYVIVISS